MAKVLTDRFVKSAKAPASGRLEVYDAALPGFSLRVTKEGKKSFTYRYRAADGPFKRMSWAYPAYSLAEARKECESVVRAVGRGEDPVAAKDEQLTLPQTVGALCDLYVERYLKKNVRRWEAAQGEIDNHIRPHIGAVRIEKLTKAHVRAMIEDVEQEYPVQANRVLARVRAVFNWGNEEDLCFIDPTRGIKRPTKEKPASRVLSDDELAKISKATDSLEYPAREYFRLLVLSGQRRDDVRLLHESELDLKMGNWVIPAARYKSGRDHLIPLTDDMIRLVEDRRGYVYSCRHGEMPYGNLQKPKRTIDRVSGVSDWTLHDIRRTVRTGLSRLGIRPDIAERVIGHSVGGKLGETYDTYSYRDEKLHALELWGAHVRAIVEGKTGKIVQFRK